MAIEQTVSITKVWEVVMYGFEAMWPAGRTELDGRSMGDVWAHSALPDDGSGWSNLVPFHKLSQWMTYSLMEPLQVRVYGTVWENLFLLCTILAVFSLFSVELF